MTLVRTELDYGNLVVEAGNIETFTYTPTAPGTLLKGSILARDTATFKLVDYVKGGTTAGNGVPLTVVTSDVTITAADVTATTKDIRGLTHATVRQDHLVIIADGDASNVNHVELDGLRHVGIDVMKVTDQSVLDN